MEEQHDRHDEGGQDLEPGELRDAGLGESRAGAKSATLPHDALFRLTFHEPEHAASELRSVIPQSLAAQIAWDELALVPGSFVDEQLQQRHSDALYRTRIDGRDTYLYVLLEHQSTPDPIMALRVLDYTVRIWRRHHQDHPASPPRLPVVIPVVLYHGHARWTAATKLSELLDLDEQDTELDAVPDGLVPSYQYLLDDVVRTSDDVLRHRPLTPAALTTLLLLRLPLGVDNVHELLADWVAQFQAARADDSDERRFDGFILYLVSTTNTPAEQIGELFATIHPDLKGTAMTTAERLRAEGEARGRAEGEARGEAKLFTSLLELRFNTLTPDVRARVNVATAEQLRAWSTRLIDGTLTLDDIAT